jgi:hypothetical protein
MEPKRNNDIDSLVDYVRARVEKILVRMKERGLDPIVYEAKRSQERQVWLYGIGRTHDLNRKPVTWTMHSKHLVGKAVDIISKEHGWNAPHFFDVLRDEARREGMDIIATEGCHIQYRG